MSQSASLVDLLADIPTNAEQRPQRWARIIADDGFFRALSGVKSSAALGVAWKELFAWEREFVRYQPPDDFTTPQQWRAARTLLVCAQVVSLERQRLAPSTRADRLGQLLGLLGADTATFDFSAAKTAAEDPGPGAWLQFIRQALLAADADGTVPAGAWAWDCVCALRGSPSAAAETIEVRVLLVDGRGVTARLYLERLDGDGSGALYPNPRMHWSIGRDAEFRQAETDARAWARVAGLWGGHRPPDIRWRLERQDRVPVRSVTGGSLGAAFAIGLAKLLADQPAMPEQAAAVLDLAALRKLELRSVAVTARVLRDGRLAAIGATFEKLLAASREHSLPNIVTVLLATEQQSDVDRIDPRLRSAGPRAEFGVVCSETVAQAVHDLAADQALRLERVPSGHLLFWDRGRLDRLVAVGGRLLGGERDLSRLRTVVGPSDRARSVVVIEGPTGIGKTSLAAALCAQLTDREVRWVSCPDVALSLPDLANALAYDRALHASPELRAVADDPSVGRHILIEALLRHFDQSRLVLVLDDYHTVADEGIRQLVKRLQQSGSGATIVLTTRRHPEEVENLDVAAVLSLSGMRRNVARRFLRLLLRSRPVYRPAAVSDTELDMIWEKASSNPGAMRSIVGRAGPRPIQELLRGLPVYDNDPNKWVVAHLRELSPHELELATLIAFVRGPASRELLAPHFPARELQDALTSLTSQFIVGEQLPFEYTLYPLYRDELLRDLGEAQQRQYSSLVARHFQSRARDLLTGTGVQIPSYGEVYIQSHPDYVDDDARHAQRIKDLANLLDDNKLLPPPGSTVLVLGSGHGIHDPGLANYGFRIINIDFAAEVVKLGRQRAAAIPAEIHYIKHDMTTPLPVEKVGMVDAAFNIGSSFGFEDEWTRNEAIFKNAAEVLKVGRPFVFEYANGRFWTKTNAVAGARSVTLSNGLIRTKYFIGDPEARTSMDVISVRYPDNRLVWYHHFMHNYTIDEIKTMMRAAGLHPVAVYGSAQGAPFDPETSSGMFIIAVRQPPAT